MPDTVHDDLRISYEESGTGEPVLFLPGTTTDSSLFLAGVLTYLPGYRAVMVDPRDTVKSDRATAGYAPKDLALEALAVLDAAGVDSAHVVGYSLGGTVAQELALAAPRRARSLFLVCTWAKTDAWLRHAFELLRDGLNGQGLGWADRAIAWLVFSPEFQEGPAYEGVLALLAARGQSPEGLERQLECDIAHDALDRLGALTCPTFVLAGEDDWWVPARYSQEIAEAIPGAKLEILPRASHGLPIERQEEFFSLLRGHLTGSSIP